MLCLNLQVRTLVSMPHHDCHVRRAARRGRPRRKGKLRHAAIYYHDELPFSTGTRSWVVQIHNISSSIYCKGQCHQQHALFDNIRRDLQCIERLPAPGDSGLITRESRMDTHRSRGFSRRLLSSFHPFSPIFLPFASLPPFVFCVPWIASSEV